MPQRLRLLATTGLAALAVSIGSAAPQAASASACGSASRTPSSVLCLINAQRHSHGLSALRLDASLSRAARGHSRDMVRRRYFSHTTPEGFSFVQRIRATGYLSGASRWLVGENLAWGWRDRSSAHRIVRAWMHSPPHREEILEPSFREVGIGIVAGVPRPLPAGGATYTTDFGVTR
jgi:uncharacterized protein YkwD